MEEVYKNIKENNSEQKHKVLIAFDDVITDMISYKKPNPIVTEIFTRDKKNQYLYCLYYGI